MIERIYKGKLSEFLKSSEKDIDFPSLIRGCRHILGMSRLRASEYLDLPEYKLKKIEHGLFSEELPSEIKNVLCSFYCLPPKLLYRKHDGFIKKKRTSCHDWKNHV